MIIPQVRPYLGQGEADAAAKSVLENWITEGPKTAEFSVGLNKLIGTPYGVFAPNGTLALVLGLMALDIEHGDEVLVPDITFIASANAVIMLGGVPVFVDVDKDTFQIDLTHADRLVSERTKAIMPVHLYGSACDMHAVKSFALKHGLKIIEDAAQGIGVYYDGVHTGGIGDVGCFSFFADKTLTTGEGGYVVCKSEAVFDRLRLLRNQGRFDRGSFIHPAIGYNFRMTDLQSAIGLVQLHKLPNIIERKLEIMKWYKELLDPIKELRILGPERLSNHVPFRCVLIAERAHDLMRHLDAEGVQTRGFFYPLHKQPCFAEWFKRVTNAPSLDDADYPNSMTGYNCGTCLPIYPTLSQQEVEYIASKIRDFFM